MYCGETQTSFSNALWGRGGGPASKTRKKAAPGEATQDLGQTPPLALPGSGTAPVVLRLQRATDYISHNAPRDGLGLAKRLEPGLRHQRPVKAVFLRR
ncbi:hypothetical protein U0070_008659 [Myodes glareolus]|uniref:Uncharacterized protein n=1 Tax=Myodes glareolus TaxID=447135 RepID=A0AAW0H5Z2_MYOGA